TGSPHSARPRALTPLTPATSPPGGPRRGRAPARPRSRRRATSAPSRRHRAVLRRPTADGLHRRATAPRRACHGAGATVTAPDAGRLFALVPERQEAVASPGDLRPERCIGEAERERAGRPVVVRGEG